MLSIHYISIMMQIFCIDWQQHWECDWTMSIGANAHGKRTVSTKQHNWQTWQLGFQWQQKSIELVFKTLDCFTMRLIHSATIFVLLNMFFLLETSPGWLLGWRGFFAGGGVGMGGLPRFGGEALISNVLTIWCRILIPRPTRVFRRSKRGSFI